MRAGPLLFGARGISSKIIPSSLASLSTKYYPPTALTQKPGARSVSISKAVE